MEPISLLVTLDQNYLPPLRVMLKSLFVNNPGEIFHIHMIHDAVPDKGIEQLDAYCRFHGARLFPYEADQNMFAGAPVFRYWSRSMYYRLLACRILPAALERALYLDPDILVINPVRALTETDLRQHLFAGAMHSGFTGNLKGQLNRIRLAYEADGYFNSGVLLMNLALQRKFIRAEELFAYVAKHKNELLLPDQDILNGLYGDRILPLDDSLYNYDARRFETYLFLSMGEKNMDWVMTNTVLLHFCGKAKPWYGNSRGRFGVLFKHYASLANRTLAETGSVYETAKF